MRKAILLLTIGAFACGGTEEPKNPYEGNARIATFSFEKDAGASEGTFELCADRTLHPSRDGNNWLASILFTTNEGDEILVDRFKPKAESDRYLFKMPILNFPRAPFQNAASWDQRYSDPAKCFSETFNDGHLRELREAFVNHLHSGNIVSAEVSLQYCDQWDLERSVVNGKYHGSCMGKYDVDSRVFENL